MAIWAKVMTSLRDHPKAIEAGHQSMWMYVTMILFSKERDTSGFVPVSFVSHSCHGRAPLRAASRLVDVGLLHPVEGGWEIVQYNEKQGADASISEKRAADAERKRRQRERESGDVTRDTLATVTPLEQSRAEQNIDTSISEPSTGTDGSPF